MNDHPNHDRTIALFGSLRMCEADGATVANVVTQLFKTFPSLEKVSQSMICAVNLKYCSLGWCFVFLSDPFGIPLTWTFFLPPSESSDVVPSDAEIALIPPIRWALFLCPFQWEGSQLMGLT